jgi:hypothetical protein
LSEELRESLEMSVEGDAKKRIRQCKEDFICAAVTVILFVTNPLPGYDWRRLRTLVCVCVCVCMCV